MTTTGNTHRIVLCALAALLLTGACSKKNTDYPTSLGVSQPQNVTNLSVTNPQAFDYDLDWDVADPGTVAYYRVYWSLDGMQFALGADSVMTTSVAVSSPLPAAVFGVTVVSTEYVEGAMVTAPVP